MIVEAILGQGEAIVSGMVEPDTYRSTSPTSQSTTCASAVRTARSSAAPTAPTRW